MSDMTFLTEADAPFKPMADGSPPPNLVTFGSDSPCTLDTCPIEWSMYEYRPSLAANATLLALFAVIGVVHAYLGFRWKSWGFMVGMILGSLSGIVGYAGRIMLWDNPWTFEGFMIQIGRSQSFSLSVSSPLHLCCRTLYGNLALTKCENSLPHHRTRLLHGFHLRYPFQSHHLLRP